MFIDVRSQFAISPTLQFVGLHSTILIHGDLSPYSKNEMTLLFISRTIGEGSNFLHQSDENLLAKVGSIIVECNSTQWEPQARLNYKGDALSTH